MMDNAFLKIFLSGMFLMLLGIVNGYGQDLVYRPINPAFGGNPYNYQWMLSSAQAQNQYQATRDYGYSYDPMSNFQESLQRQILSELTRKLVTNKFGDIDLSEESNFSFGEFSIDVVPGAAGVEVRIYNSSTGEQTSITIPNWP